MVCIPTEHPRNIHNVRLLFLSIAWWRNQMETFSTLLAICAGNSPVTDDFPAQRPVTRSFDVFFDLRLNERLSKQSWGWWFETPSHPLWRHGNDGLRTNKTPQKHAQCTPIVFVCCLFCTYPSWSLIKIDTWPVKERWGIWANILMQSTKMYYSMSKRLDDLVFKPRDLQYKS